MDQAQGTQQVDLDQGDDALPRHGSERSLGVDAGVVEENVEPVTAGLAELGNRGEDRRSVGHVEASEDSGSCAQFGAQGLERGLIDVEAADEPARDANSRAVAKPMPEAAPVTRMERRTSRSPLLSTARPPSPEREERSTCEPAKTRSVPTTLRPSPGRRRAHPVRPATSG